MQGKQEYQSPLFSTIQIESLIPKNHLLRKLDESLDLSFVRTLTEPLYCKGNGRPSIDPEVFIRMMLIEYLFDVPSDRQLCEEIGFNLAYRWFCRFSLEDEIPDHSSLTRIRDRLGEATFQKIFIHIVKLCEEKGLVKGKRVMTDGSLIKANAALKSLTERDPPLTGGAQSTPPPVVETKQETQNNQSKEETKKKRKSKPIKGKTFSNKTHVSQTDPDSTLAGKTDEKKQLRYKLHKSLDADHRIIVDCHVTTESVPDGNVYCERLSKIENCFEFKIEEATADRGYGYGENLQHLKDHGINSFIPRFHKDVGEKIDRSKTPYDAEKDEFRCELGNPLLRGNNMADGNAVYKPQPGSCKGCERFVWCVIKRRGLRTNPYHQVQHETRLKESTSEFKEKVRERMWKVEGLFGEAKTNHGLSRARYRGLWKVQVQAYLIASVMNLKRLVTASLGDLAAIFEKITEIFEILSWRLSIKKNLILCSKPFNETGLFNTPICHMTAK